MTYMLKTTKWQKSAKKTYKPTYKRPYMLALVLAALAVLTAPVAAHAADTPASLRVEATHLLSVCPPAKMAGHRACRINQRNFVVDYICAFTGEYWAQKNIAFDLAAENASQTSGVMPIDLLSCAWAQLVSVQDNLATSADVSEADRYCAFLDAAARRVAAIKAAIIEARIQAFRRTVKRSRYCP